MMYDDINYLRKARYAVGFLKVIVMMNITKSFATSTTCDMFLHRHSES